MESSFIYKLIDKYWRCETSIEEEIQLQYFFRRKDIPEDLKQFQPLFAFKNSEKMKCLSPQFDEKLNKTIQSSLKQKNRYLTIKIFAPTLKWAVSAFLIITLGTSIYLIAEKRNSHYYAETYNDPDAATKYATFALDKLSEALNEGENASKQSLQFINNMDINWVEIDSLIQEYEIQDSADMNINNESEL